MWLLILWAFSIVAVHSKPQGFVFDQSKPNVEIQPQDILHLTTFNSSIKDDASQKRIEENTREILQKIEALNKKHGLTKKKKPTYFHFPFSYSRSQEDTRDQPINQQQDFKFPNNPFQNPIFEYLGKNQELPDQLKSSSAQFPGGITVVETNPNAEITDADQIPGQYIKRKVTHYQTVLVPNVQNNMNRYAFMPNSDTSNPNQAIINQYFTNNPPNQKKNNKVSNLEKQTVNNIKNIIYNSQPNPYYNPYAAPQYERNQNQPLGLLYGPYVVPNPDAAYLQRQFQFQSPLHDYFPMVIKDPFVQLFNAFTSMVEYGPPAAMDSCKKDDSKRDKEGDAKLEGKEEPQENEDIHGNDELFYTTDNHEIAEDDLVLVGLNETHVENKNSTNVRFPKLKEVPENLGDETQMIQATRISKGKIQTKSKIPTSTSNLKAANPSGYIVKENKIQSSHPQLTKLPTMHREPSRPSLNPPPRSEQIYEEEMEDEKRLSFFKPTQAPLFTSGQDVQLSNDGNKRLISRDNTGNGIFIHRLKVRKGGVAIAGPGGIATAGEGGTAIVGPNGYAYTQPDSLAIAGTGTKVIAVEPTINLSDFVKNNRTRVGTDAGRIGKVVAVGPVIYYNKG